VSNYCITITVESEDPEQVYYARLAAEVAVDDQPACRIIGSTHWVEGEVPA